MKHMIAHCVAGTELLQQVTTCYDPFFTESEVQLALRSVHRVAERLGVRRPKVRETKSPPDVTSHVDEAGAPGLCRPFGWSPEALGKLRVETVTVYVHPAK